MGLFHKATITPSKQEVLAAWVPTQSWCPHPEAPVEMIGGYRFDDPEGQVGMETALVLNDGVVLNVPMTYRAEPVESNADGLVADFHHSALGQRWVYDGMTEDLYVTMLAAVSLTGQGEALGMVMHEGAWIVAPSNIRILGGGWPNERTVVNGFERVQSAGSDTSTDVFRNERFEMAVHRQPVAGSQPEVGLTASWADSSPVVITEITPL